LRNLLPDISFTVPVEPTPKNSTKWGRGRAYTPAKVRDATKAIRDYIKENYHGDPLDGPLGLDVVYYRRRPQSKRRSKVWADTKPDEDNYTKLFKDALEGILWTNDSRISDGRYRKMFTDGPGRIEFRLWKLQE
jgi:Holliday junction resolvase RusA-like endonuclease